MSDHHSFDYDGIKYRIESRPPLVFTILFSGLVLWALGFMGYFLFSDWSSVGEYVQEKKANDALKAASAAAAPVKVAPGDPQVGAAVFAERCAACHGADAKGKIGPDLTRKDYKYGKSEAAITESISKGRPGGMPGFGDLAPEKIAGLAAYLLHL
ncbi:cytochrome c [Geomonas sp. RF6]|uniref:c-type cytochrome n=1 Tax=Geomonas sp. RF6 TaxID=2897342 RepID=UPI001E50E5E9|nr:c-type cytochrome [Geomonas sp. RF6]UFS71114.1 cytochrome c [Geomonas sp. RF6]